jgi:hypothetical protein
MIQLAKIAMFARRSPDCAGLSSCPERAETWNIPAAWTRSAALVQVGGFVAAPQTRLPEVAGSDSYS